MKKVFQIVSKALRCDLESLDKKSGLYSHPAWDSFGQLSIIAEIETQLNIVIPNDQILDLSSIEQIIEFIERGKND